MYSIAPADWAMFEDRFFFVYIHFDQMSTGLANGPGDRGSTPGRVILTTQKLILDSALLNTQQYKVWMKGKGEQCREWSGTAPLQLDVVNPRVTLDYDHQLMRTKAQTYINIHTLPID